jgi:hypothetical protein
MHLARYVAASLYYKKLGSYVFITAIETTEKQVLFWEMKSRLGHDASMLTGYA